MCKLVDESRFSLIRVYRRDRPIVDKAGWYTAAMIRVNDALEVIRDINNSNFGIIILKPREELPHVRRKDLSEIIDSAWCLQSNDVEFKRITERNTLVRVLHCNR